MTMRVRVSLQLTETPQTGAPSPPAPPPAGYDVSRTFLLKLEDECSPGVAVWYEPGAGLDSVLVGGDWRVALGDFIPSTLTVTVKSEHHRRVILRARLDESGVARPEVVDMSAGFVVTGHVVEIALHPDLPTAEQLVDVLNAHPRLRAGVIRLLEARSQLNSQEVGPK